jgi:hypothetical protein
VTILALVALLWRTTRRQDALHLDAQFYARRGAQEVRLQDGDVVTQGDLLVLAASSPEPFHAYVFNLDDAGEMYVLFPVPGFELSNPLGSRVEHRLPGSFHGEPQYWEVTSGGGGGENVLLVAARAPVPAMEELLASIPPVVPGESPSYPEVPTQTRTALLRGIGGTASLPGSADAFAARTGTTKLDLGSIIEQLELAPGFAVRTLHLQNR